MSERTDALQVFLFTVQRLLCRAFFFPFFLLFETLFGVDTCSVGAPSLAGSSV